MFKSYCIALSIGLFLLRPAVADGRWVLAEGDDGFKFGYSASGGDGFDLLWFLCDARSKQISAYASVGDRRPASGQGSFTVGMGDILITLAGPVGQFDVDGIFFLETKIAHTHPILSILRNNSRVTYASARFSGTMPATGLKAAAVEFTERCR